MVLLVEKTDSHKGKILSHFEDESGNKLDDLYMCDSIVIVFINGDKIILGQDWRGSECYFSQYDT